MNPDKALSYGEKRALAEIESIMHSQWANGMLPQIRFVKGQAGYSPDEHEWGVTKDISGCDQDTSGITQPPLLGYALMKIFWKSGNKSRVICELDKFFDGVDNYHAFLLRERDPNDEYLLSVIHPWETGTDNAPYLDDIVHRAKVFLRKHGYENRIIKRKDIQRVESRYRPTEKDYECYGRLIDFFIKHRFDQNEIIHQSPFIVQDVLFNSIFAGSVKAMSLLADALSRVPLLKNKRAYYKAKSVKNQEWYQKIRSAIQNKLYDEDRGLFYSKNLRDNSFCKIDTVHCISPLFGQCATHQQAHTVLEHLLNKNEFKTEMMIPTVSLLMRDHHKFDPLRYWRGPVWPVTNWIIYEGLKHYDAALADKLRQSTLSLIDQRKPNDTSEAFHWAADLMKFNSYEGCYTTPSKTQYMHGWFWDSCLAAIGWIRIEKEPGTPDLCKKNPRQLKFWSAFREQLKHPDKIKRPADVYVAVSKKLNRAVFSEYFVPIPYEKEEQGRKKTYNPGDPIGAPLMTWTAALYLDLLNSGGEKHVH